MKWNKEAFQSLEAVPVPPVMACYAKLDAEMRARRKGLQDIRQQQAAAGVLFVFNTKFLFAWC